MLDCFCLSQIDSSDSRGRARAGIWQESGRRNLDCEKVHRLPIGQKELSGRKDIFGLPMLVDIRSNGVRLFG